jgi:predicted MFS family arabinose efflux permease
VGVIAPVFLGIAIASVLGWRAGIWVAVVAFVAVEIWRGRSLSVFGEPGQVLTRKASGALPTLTYWALVANMCYVGAEFCMSLWGVDLLREQVGLSPAAAAAGLGALTGGIFVGRAFGAGITRAVPAERLLIISRHSSSRASGSHCNGRSAWLGSCAHAEDAQTAPRARH